MLCYYLVLSSDGVVICSMLFVVVWCYDKDNMEITFQLLAQTVIAALLITVAVICWMYGDEDSKSKEEEEEEEEEARLVGEHQRK